ncbi:MAG: aldose 1-epimerase family protein [Lachnospiraceae bacterium]|nr:aldose 1-epimerase family protein [Lachnospiraceae bacterium]
MVIELKNDWLKVEIDSFGAEIKSVKNKNGVEYMWNADEKYWKRTAPVLFPFVGSLRDKEYTYKGKKYPMGQHGFARDMEFDVVSQDAKSVWFELKANGDTLKVYPFKFCLRIGYELEGECLKVLWDVSNQGKDDVMHFSIGAHPAFMCPLNGEKTKAGYSLNFNTKEGLIYSRINNEGLMKNYKTEVMFDKDGKIVMDDHFFDEGVYIVEDYQANRVVLEDKNGKAYITMKFDAPLFGLWSPDKDAPFLCIEPWYGRCDRETYEDDLTRREYNNKLKPDENWKRSYTITFNK